VVLLSNAEGVACLTTAELSVYPAWRLWEAASSIKHLASVKGEQNIYQTWNDQKL